MTCYTIIHGVSTMGRRPKPSTLVRIYKHDRQKLQFCSVALAKDQILILNEVLSELYKAVFPLFGESVSTKRPIRVFYDIKAIVQHETMITGSYAEDMSVPDSEAKKRLVEHVEKQYAEKEGK